MGYINSDVKFPCGYEYGVEVRVWNLSRFLTTSLPVCPHHGRDCKPNTMLELFGAHTNPKHNGQHVFVPASKSPLSGSEN